MGQGPARSSCEPEPSQAEPKPGLLSRAGPCKSLILNRAGVSTCGGREGSCVLVVIWSFLFVAGECSDSSSRRSYWPLLSSWTQMSRRVPEETFFSCGSIRKTLYLLIVLFCAFYPKNRKSRKKPSPTLARVLLKPVKKANPLPKAL